MSRMVLSLPLVISVFICQCCYCSEQNAVALPTLQTVSTMWLSPIQGTSAQGTSAPMPDPSLRFSLWQQSNQSTTASADVQTQFREWQGQRTTADSINLFKCTTSTDLDNPECVGNPPGTKITGTKDAKTPTTLPLPKSKTGDPD